MLSNICLWAAPYTAKIEHVTVFTNGAEIQHRVSLPLQAGDNTVVIENISPNINEQSLQIALGGGVIVQNYAFSTDYLSADKRKMNTAALEDSLKLAKELGATDTVNRKKTDDLVAEVKRVSLSGNGVNYSIDTTGV